jgi:lambda repressor-like predicted transcriptional regulator
MPKLDFISPAQQSAIDAISAALSSGLTLRMLAKQCGVSHQTIKNVAEHKYATLRVSVIKRIMRGCVK